MNKLAVIFLCILTGCSLNPFKHKSESFKATIPNGPTMQGTGPILEPGKTSLTDTQTTLPLPAGTTVTFEGGITASATAIANGEHSETAAPAPAAKPVTITLPQPSQLTVTTRTQTAETPKSFAPPAPPTPSDIAKGKGILMYYFIGGFLAVAAIALVYLQHAKAAIICGIGAILVPACANFLSNDTAVKVLLVIVAIAATLVGAWYLAKNHPDIIADAKAEADKLRIAAENERDKLREQVIKLTSGNG